VSLEHETVEIPHPAAPEPGAADRPRTRRRIVAVVVAVVMTVLIVVAIVVADGIARGIIAARIEATMRSALAIPASTPVVVTVGGDSALGQLIGGRLDDVRVSSDSVTFGDLEGSLDARGSGVPTDGSSPVERLQLEFSVDDEGLGGIAGSLGDVQVSSVGIVDDLIEVRSDLDLLGFTVPIGVGLSVEAVDGGLSLSPQRIEVNGAVVTAAELRDDIGAAVDGALQIQTVCLAEYLPATFRLDRAAVTGDALELRLSGDGSVLGELEGAPRGSCDGG
jgi:hypothetical protein